MPCPDQQFVFVASNLEDQMQAEREIVAWASLHGYRLPQTDRVFQLYSDLLSAREWRLLERSLN